MLKEDFYGGDGRAGHSGAEDQPWSTHSLGSELKQRGRRAPGTEEAAERTEGESRKVTARLDKCPPSPTQAVASCEEWGPVSEAPVRRDKGGDRKEKKMCDVPGAELLRSSPGAGGWFSDFCRRWPGGPAESASTVQYSWWPSSAWARS